MVAEYHGPHKARGYGRCSAGGPGCASVSGCALNLAPGANTTIPRLDLLDGSRGLFVSKQMFAKPLKC